MASPDEGSPLSARSEVQSVEPEEAYGPHTFRRYVKDDGRALALYVRGTLPESTGAARA
jgi:hypothetical protein